MEFGSEVQHRSKKVVNISKFLSEVAEAADKYVVQEMTLTGDIIRQQVVNTGDEATRLKHEWERD
jgi:hypothetical protein